jgi:hypothetical protein
MKYELIIIATILIISLLIYLRFRMPKFVEADLAISLYVLNLATNNYKELILTPRIEGLERIYDLDKKSKTNSSKQFKEQCEILLKQSAKEILESQISAATKKNLFKYFTIDSLLIHVISLLRS